MRCNECAPNACTLTQEKAWGVKFDPPGSSIVAFLCRGRQCGFNTKHQSTRRRRRGARVGRRPRSSATSRTSRPRARAPTLGATTTPRFKRPRAPRFLPHTSPKIDGAQPFGETIAMRIVGEKRAKRRTTEDSWAHWSTRAIVDIGDHESS
jgi:hypothetical protein